MPKIVATRAALHRSLDPVVEEDLLSKMVFVARPRQCGKTTLARVMLAKLGGSCQNKIEMSGHEVDAVVLRKGKPWLAVEVKTSDEPVDRGLRYLLERQTIPWAFQLSLKGTRDTLDRSVGAKGVRLMPAAKFLAQLP